MFHMHCANCGRTMGFKRNLGFGTLLAFIFTGGLWLFVIPFYPRRCVGCGAAVGQLRDAAPPSRS